MEEKTNIVDSIVGLKIFNVIRYNEIITNTIQIHLVDLEIETKEDKIIKRRNAIIGYLIDNNPYYTTILDSDTELYPTLTTSMCLYRQDINIFKSTKYNISNSVYNLINTVTSDNINSDLLLRYKVANESSYDYLIYTSRSIEVNIRKLCMVNIKKSNEFTVLCGMGILDLYDPDLLNYKSNIYFDPNIDDNLVIIANIGKNNSGLYFIYDDSYSYYGLDKTKGYMNNITWFRVN
jgi:hypothetical protein